MTPLHLLLQDALRRALLCNEPTTQLERLVFSEPEEACTLFNPVEEVGKVGDVRLEQDALMSHHYDYEGEPTPHAYQAHGRSQVCYSQCMHVHLLFNVTTVCDISVALLASGYCKLVTVTPLQFKF